MRHEFYSCFKCHHEFTKTVSIGENINCPNCGNLVKDGFDWEDEQEEDSKMTDQERFEAFTKELSKLSEKYSILIASVGGVHIFNEGVLSEVKYSNDSTSGDLRPYSYKVVNK